MIEAWESCNFMKKQKNGWLLRRHIREIFDKVKIIIKLKDLLNV